MRGTEINRLVIKFLRELGFALFSKKAKMLLYDEIPEFPPKPFLKNEKESFCCYCLCCGFTSCSCFIQ